MKDTLAADEVIAEIAEVLSEANESFIEEIANLVLTRKVTYDGDGFFTQETAA